MIILAYIFNSIGFIRVINKIGVGFKPVSVAVFTVYDNLIYLILWDEHFSVRQITRFSFKRNRLSFHTLNNFCNIRYRILSCIIKANDFHTGIVVIHQLVVLFENLSTLFVILEHIGNFFNHIGIAENTVNFFLYWLQTIIFIGIIVTQITDKFCKPVGNFIEFVVINLIKFILRHISADIKKFTNTNSRLLPSEMCCRTCFSRCAFSNTNTVFIIPKGYLFTVKDKACTVSAVKKFKHSCVILNTSVPSEVHSYLYSAVFIVESTA